MNTAEFQQSVLVLLKHLNDHPTNSLQWAVYVITELAEKLDKPVSISKDDIRLERIMDIQTRNCQRLFEIQTNLADLESKFATHTHQGNIGYPTSKATTGPLGPICPCGRDISRFLKCSGTARCNHPNCNF